jgi:hypothetical protein
MSEAFLHFLWQHKLYKPGVFYTSNRKQMEVVHPGLSNSDAGPDFFNAKIKLDGMLWAGNVEIHHKASEWVRHRHHCDPLYDNVVLHVVLINDEEIFSTNGRRIPAWEMEVSEKVRKEYRGLQEHKGWIACEGKIELVPVIEVNNWVERMLVEKLEQKISYVQDLLDVYCSDWQEVFYVVLSRNFGFGLNGDAFERLARQTPWKIVGRNADSSEKLEALFLGQAGFLDGLVYDDNYISLLHREYGILQNKYGLQSLPSHLWKFLRLRPVNFPTIRLVQLSALLARENALFDALLHCRNLSEARELLYAEPSDYWRQHFRPGAKGKASSKKLGRQAIDLIIINTVIPLLFAFGKLRGKPLFQQKAIDWLGELPPESNRIVKEWEAPGIGISALSAADSQGLVYLKKHYCDHRKCLCCRIGHKVVAGIHPE